METFWQTRSKAMVYGVAGVLVAGAICAYAFPSLKFDGYSVFGTSVNESASFGDLKLGLDVADKGWLYDLARLGVIAAIIAAIAFPVAQSGAQRLVIALGCIAGVSLPIYVFTQLEDGVSAGAGLILLLIACSLAGIMALFVPVEPAESPRLSDGITPFSPSAVAIDPSAPYMRVATTSPTTTPSLRLTPVSGTPGSEVRFKAEHFPAGSAVRFSYFDTETSKRVEIGVRNASPTGAVEWTYVFPEDILPGRKHLRVEGGNKHATAPFMIEA